MDFLKTPMKRSIFPPTDTNIFTHAICVLGASSAGAFSDNFFGLEYTVVPDFRDGVKLRDDRTYVAEGVQGPEMCEGGIYPRPSLAKVSIYFLLW